MTGDLPPGWVWARFGDIADTQLGKMLSAKSRQGLAPMPYLRNQNVQWHRIDLTDVASMDFTDYERAKYQLQPGDLLICEGGEVGRCARWTLPTIEMCFQKALHRVRPRPGIETGWIEYFMRWAAETGRFGDHVQGSTIAHLPQRDLRALMVPVPPPKEQRLIVAAIEEHFSRLDAVEASIAAAETKCAALSSIAMSQLFSHEWPKSRLDAVAQVGSGATPKRSERKYWSHGTIPWVASGAVNQLSIWSADEFISERALAETSVKLWPAGTVLMAMYGEGKTRGKAAMLEFESTCNQACAAINCDQSRLDGRFLRTFLNAQYEVNRRLSSGGVQPNLNLGLIKSMEVPVPNLEVQESIAAQAEEIDSACSQLLEACARARRNISGLRRTILGEAFAGRLIPENPRGDYALDLVDSAYAS